MSLYSRVGTPYSQNNSLWLAHQPGDASSHFLLAIQEGILLNFSLLIFFLKRLSNVNDVLQHL